MPITESLIAHNEHNLSCGIAYDIIHWKMENSTTNDGPRKNIGGLYKSENISLCIAMYQ